MKAVQFGAGNIGRGFLGQLFFQSGLHTTFVDVDAELVHRLNQAGCYPLTILGSDSASETVISNFTAVEAGDRAAVSSALTEADIAATAVGVNALPHVVPLIAEGLLTRWKQGVAAPINILLCENLLDASTYVHSLLAQALPSTYHPQLDQLVGLVETSIGRMVPVMTDAMMQGNPLRICAEAYCELPVDAAGFRGTIPAIKHMVPVTPFAPYSERKLFLHNMAHAAAAYLGHLKGYAFIWEAVSDSEVQVLVKGAMEESAEALSRKHSMPLSELQAFGSDLLKRFANWQLGDTVSRVGRDTARKLAANDRLVGAARMCIKQKVCPEYLCAAIAAALWYSRTQPGEERVADMMARGGPVQALASAGGLPADSDIALRAARFYRAIAARQDQGEALASLLQMIEI